MDTLTMPDDHAYPFRLGDDGIIYRFSWRNLRWQVANTTIKSDGYHIVPITAARVRKVWYFHRLVWELNHGPIPHGLEINHINMDKGDNRIENLELVSHGDNIRKARAILGNWSAETKATKLRPHQRALAILLPSCANWKALAERWGVHKVYLLGLRSNRGDEALVPRFGYGVKGPYKTRADKGIPRQTR